MAQAVVEQAESACHFIFVKIFLQLIVYRHVIGRTGENNDRQQTANYPTAHGKNLCEGIRICLFPAKHSLLVRADMVTVYFR